LAAATIYNERLKLLASAINLIAIGMIAIGVTTPLVSASFGAQIYGARTITNMLPVLGVWGAGALIMHIFAQLILGRMVP
jgi:hypothetical protein